MNEGRFGGVRGRVEGECERRAGDLHAERGGEEGGGELFDGCRG